MKYLKTYETLHATSIEIGKIYYIGNWLLDYKSTIKLCKILAHDEYKWTLIVKTFLKSNHEEATFEISRKSIVRKAKPDEIEEFEAIENENKYNL